MKTNTIVWVVVGIVVIGGAFMLSSRDAEAPGSEMQVVSAVGVDRQLHDFGEIDINGGLVTTDFTLTNEGSEDVMITNGTTSCGCTTAEIGGIDFGMHEGMASSLTIPAGESRDLTVIFDPLAHGPAGVGLAQRSVYLQTNSSFTPQLEVRIKALVTNNN